MKLKESLVSVILPVYNAGKFLPQCLQALAKQSYQHVEIIAVSDNSKDNSLKVLKTFKKQFKKIQIVPNKKHYGTAVCLNRALKLASGQFIAFMNPFDTISVHRFKKQVKHLLENPKTVAVGSQFVTINEKNRTLEKSSLPLEHDAIYHTLVSSISIKPETVMINRMLVPSDIMRFTTNKYPIVFTEVFIKLLQYGQISNLDQCLYQHRVGIKHRTHRNRKIKQAFSIMQLLLKSRSIYDYRPSLFSSLPAMLRNT